VRARLAIAACGLLVPLAAAAPAGASFGLAELRAPGGAVIARAGSGGFAFPGNGASVSIASAGIEARPLRAVLRGVSLLGGRVRAERIDVPGRGLRGARVLGLTVDGVAVRAGANTYVPLGRDGYVVALQQALAPRRDGATRVGVVGLRVHLTRRVPGLRAGSEMWLGLAAGASTGGGLLAGSVDEIPPKLMPLYRRAGARYGVPWSVLAAINKAETAFGRNLNVSSAGAVGWMQFMPATWRGYGVDANGDGKRDPWHPEDAIFAAARLLAANGARTDLSNAVFQYNHSTSYVAGVLADAARYAAAGPLRGAGALDPTELGS
jgi:hypothetical protein